MSITKDFEKRLLPIENSTVYGKDETEALLEHARALEAMLKKHEWHGRENNDGSNIWCPECGVDCGILEDRPHVSDCQLAKLLEGVEPIGS